MIVCENSAMKRILLVKTSSLGDVIHNLPVVNDILQHHPDAKIDWLVEASFADIPKLHPKVNRVHTVAIRRWRKQLLSSSTWREIRAFKQAISAQPYDLVIDTQGLLKSAIMTTFTHGKRYGMDKSSAREPIASRFYHQRFTIAKDQHAVTRNRELVAYACGDAKPSTLPDYGIQTSSDLGSTFAKPYVIGLHGTSRDSKLWPTEHWQGLAQYLAKQNTQLLLPWASDAEKQRADTIAGASGNVTVLPKSSIANLASIIQGAHFAIGVDTGLSHLAVALSTPTIALYTDTNPALTGVHAGAHAPAINLGNKNQIPAVETVIKTIDQLTQQSI